MTPEIEQYITWPTRRDPHPPYDVEGGLAFIKKYTSLCTAGTHYVVLACPKWTARFDAIQTALGATFEKEPVPNFSGVVAFNYPRALLGPGELVRVINDLHPVDLTVEDVAVEVVAL